MKTLFYTLAILIFTNTAYAQKDLQLINPKRVLEDTVDFVDEKTCVIPVIIINVGNVAIPSSDNLVIGLVDPDGPYQFQNGTIRPISHGIINIGDTIKFEVNYTFNILKEGSKRYMLTIALLNTNNNGFVDLNFDNNEFPLTVFYKFKVGLNKLNASNKNLVVSKSRDDANLLMVTNPNHLKGTLNIYSIDGKLVYSDLFSTETTQIKLNQFNKGIYLIKFSENNNSALYSNKFIVE